VVVHVFVTQLVASLLSVSSVVSGTTRLGGIKLDSIKHQAGQDTNCETVPYEEYPC